MCMHHVHINANRNLRTLLIVRLSQKSFPITYIMDIITKFTLISIYMRRYIYAQKDSITSIYFWNAILCQTGKVYMPLKIIRHKILMSIGLNFKDEKWKICKHLVSRVFSNRFYNLPFPEIIVLHCLTPRSLSQ